MGHHVGTVEYIAGWRTADDWHAFRDTLKVGDPNGWDVAFAEYFEQRLSRRYLQPIETLQVEHHRQGEGFAICTIQCSLIEFLESTAEGTTYKFQSKGAVLGPYEYSSSKNTFVNFLTKRAPFSNVFNPSSAESFYAGVRCGLLHEARTNGGWRIWADTDTGAPVDVVRKIVFRNTFQQALMQYIASYGTELPNSRRLQEAFIRKYDSLCA